MHFYVRCHFL